MESKYQRFDNRSMEKKNKRLRKSTVVLVILCILFLLDVIFLFNQLQMQKLWNKLVRENQKDIRKHEYSEEKDYNVKQKLQISDGLWEHKFPVNPVISEFYGEKSSGKAPELYAPKVKGYLLDVTANTTDSKILYCRFTGDPKPEVSWNHNIAHAQQVDNVVTGLSQVISRLMIRNLTYHDSGKVSCSGKNVFGQSKADGFLNIHQRPKVSCPEKLVTAYLGTTYAFPQCNITGNPLAVISWRREFGNVSNFRTLVNKKHQLEILNVEASDEGTYVIRAHNYLGSSESKIRLNVKPMSFITTPPSRITQGEQVTCAAEGKISNMRGRWITLLKPHDDLRSTHEINGNVYSVTIKLENPGVYQCQFTDGKTKINATTMLPNDRRSPHYSNILSTNQSGTLLGWLKETATLTLCWKSDVTFDESAYRACLSTSSSVTIMSLEYDVFGVFNDIKHKASFGFDCRYRAKCKKVTTNMYPVCIETSPKANTGNRNCDDNDDLIIWRFNFRTKCRFRSLWNQRYFKFKRMEVLNVI